MDHYVVEMDEPAAETPCECGGCPWTGPFSALSDIEGCALTPGDDSPAGRCPECDTLAYVATPAAKLKDSTPKLRAIIKQLLEPFSSYTERDLIAFESRDALSSEIAVTVRAARLLICSPNG
jgi:hypothetical protein